MQTSTSLSVLNVAGKEVRIARDADFRDFVTLATSQELHLAVRALRAMVERAGNVRNPRIDLARQRLAQLRQQLH